MSSGLVVCSACRREVHQWGARVADHPRPTSGAARGWLHCDDRTPMCADATADYPAPGESPRGRWCGADGGVL